MYRKSVLENGVRVVTHAVAGLRSCTLGVFYDVGPRDEPSTLAGIAHFTEHLMFEGTSNRDSLSIARTIDTMGGQVGAFTTRDYTCYAATILDDYSPYLLDLFGDLLLNSTFPAEAVAAQRGAVARELAAMADQPDRLVSDRLKSLVWGDHPLGRPVAGTPDTVARITREEIIYFTAGNYLPDRMIVAAAGSVDHDDFVAQVRDGFWRLIGEAGRRDPRPPRFISGCEVLNQPLNQAYFALALPAPNYTSSDRYAWHLLTTILGGGLSSRLFRDVRENRGLAFHIAAEYQAYADAGLLVVEGATAPEDVVQVVELVRENLSELACGKKPIDPDELWRAQMQLRGQHLLGGQDSSTLFSRLVTQEHYFGNPIPSDVVQQAIEAVDTATLAEIAGPLETTLQKAALVVAGPECRSLTQERLQAVIQYT